MPRLSRHDAPPRRLIPTIPTIPTIATIALALAAASAFAQNAPLPEASASETGIGYASPAAAFRALKADRAVQFDHHDGWTIAYDRAHQSVWTFAPTDSPAYPALVKRTVVARAGGLALETGVLCGGTKAVCDDFVRQFIALNDQMARAMAARGAASTPAPAQ